MRRVTRRTTTGLRFRGAFAVAMMLLMVPGILAAAERARMALPPAAARLDAALHRVGGLRADFVQIREVEISGEEIQGRGFIAFRPPASFRLAYVSPEPQEIVVVGDSLWVVLPAESQAIRYPFSIDAPGSEIFHIFGGGESSLGDVFSITQEAWAGYGDALRLEPREEDPGYPLQDIRLVVGTDGFPQRLYYREITGDTVMFNFTRVTADPPDLEDLLRLVLAPGIEVIDGAP